LDQPPVFLDANKNLKKGEYYQCLNYYKVEKFFRIYKYIPKVYHISAIEPFDRFLGINKVKTIG